MGQSSVSIQELKSRLKYYLELTKAGESVLITERGTPIGRIVPTCATREERISVMVQAGLACWSGKKIGPRLPVARVLGKRSVADLLIENRE